MIQENVWAQIFGSVLVLVVLGFLGQKGIACVRNPAGEREKLINSAAVGPLQDLRSAWTPVWFVRVWGVLVCSMVSLVVILLVVKIIGLIR